MLHSARLLAYGLTSPPPSLPAGKWHLEACIRLQRRDRARFSRASDNRCKTHSENSAFVWRMSTGIC
jgi:hypothetical protein